MRAITVTEDNRLQLETLPEPVPTEGEILIDVVAAGINGADIAQAAGMYPPPRGASPLLGLEVSGHRRDTGEPVVALLAGGGYAEVVAVPEEHVLPIPDDLTMVEAGGLIEVAATVVSNLVIEAGMPIHPAEDERPTVLIQGGTGGIGTFAIQFAAAVGARVVTTVGSDEAIEVAKELGAEHAWNRHVTDVTAAVKNLGGVDIVLDVVGGPALSDHVRILREFGRIVVISTIAGRKGEVNLSALMGKRARIIGTTLRSRAADDKRRILERTRELVWPLVASGEIRVPVHARFPLGDAERAHEVLKRGGHVGKVVIEVTR